MEQNQMLKIFLVDDEPFCLDIYSQYLKNLGQKDIYRYASSAQCLNDLPLQPDLIFLDYHMDSINGIDTLKKIKRFNPNALVVFISGQEEISVAVNALKYGAFDYLSKKQINEERMNNVLQKAIGITELIETARRKSKFQRLLGSLGLGSLVLIYNKLASKL